MSSSVAHQFRILGRPQRRPPVESDLAAEVVVEAEEYVLLRRVAVSDNDALSDLFERYSGLVKRIASRILCDSTEADDLVQDLFLFIQRKADVFDHSKSSARSWIVQMTYQQAIQRRRYLTMRNFYGKATKQGELDSVVAVPTGESDYSPEIVFGRNGLKKVIEEMSQEQRETLRLYFFDGYTLTEISEKLGQPLGNVRHYYYRGMDKLRKEMFSGSVRKS